MRLAFGMIDIFLIFKRFAAFASENGTRRAVGVYTTARQFIKSQEKSFVAARWMNAIWMDDWRMGEGSGSASAGCSSLALVDDY